MNEVSIDVYQRRAIIAFINKVCIPQLVVKRASHNKILCKRVEQPHCSATSMKTPEGHKRRGVYHKTLRSADP